MTCDVLLT